MASARKMGRYTGHNTPGDGTGLDSMPTKQWDEAVTNEYAESGANVGPIQYPQRTEAPERGMGKAVNTGTKTTGYRRMSR